MVFRKDSQRLRVGTIMDTYTYLSPYLLPDEIYVHIAYISCNFNYLLIGVTKAERSATSHAHACFSV